MQRCHRRKKLRAHHSKIWSAFYVAEGKNEGIDPLFVQNRRESTVLGVK